MKRPNIIFVLILILLILILALANEYSELSDQDVVSGVAIDKTDNRWTVTCEICMPSTDNAFGSQSVYVKGEGYTLDDAFESARLKSSNTLYTDSVQLYLVNSRLVGDGELNNYFKSRNINMRAVTACTDGPARDLLDEQTEQNERAKSMSLVKKVKNYADSMSLPEPNVLQFMRGEHIVFLSPDKALREVTND